MSPVWPPQWWSGRNLQGGGYNPHSGYDPGPVPRTRYMEGNATNSEATNQNNGEKGSDVPNRKKRQIPDQETTITTTTPPITTAADETVESEANPDVKRRSRSRSMRQCVGDAHHLVPEGGSLVVTDQYRLHHHHHHHHHHYTLVPFQTKEEAVQVEDCLQKVSVDLGQVVVEMVVGTDLQVKSGLQMELEVEDGSRRWSWRWRMGEGSGSYPGIPPDFSEPQIPFSQPELPPLSNAGGGGGGDGWGGGGGGGGGGGEGTAGGGTGSSYPGNPTYFPELPFLFSQPEFPLVPQNLSNPSSRSGPGQRRWSSGRSWN